MMWTVLRPSVNRTCCILKTKPVIREHLMREVINSMTAYERVHMPFFYKKTGTYKSNVKLIGYGYI